MRDNIGSIFYKDVESLDAENLKHLYFSWSQFPVDLVIISQLLSVLCTGPAHLTFLT